MKVLGAWECLVVDRELGTWRGNLLRIPKEMVQACEVRPLGEEE